jgi:hypothetical protein
VCGPVASAQVEHLLRPFCRRIAVGVSLTDGTEGLFDAALPRDDDADGTPGPTSAWPTVPARRRWWA